jgi:hypothetical protein
LGIVRTHLGSVLVGVLAMGGIAFVGAQELNPQSPEVVLTQGQEAPGEEQGRPGRGGRHKFRPGLHRAVRGEFVVPGEDEGTFRTVRVDRGVIERVEGSMVVIKEDDGTTIEVPTSDETRIRRDGERANVADLRAGDHVRTMRIDVGDGLVTRAVQALSPERWQELDQRRERGRPSQNAPADNAPVENVPT